MLHPELADDPAGLSVLKRMLATTRQQGFGTVFQETERGVGSVDSWPWRGLASSNSPMVRKPSLCSGSELSGTGLPRPRR